ncbi:thiamine phosphate synthase [bacterium]|nr:thiamine phosphate synthase [bacterium]MCP5462429.1 thiamine phosphate synthase [bacterium]
MNLLNNKTLYLILDTSYISVECLPAVAVECCEGGVDIIQFRDKILSDKEKLETALVLKKTIFPFSIPFIINDRIDIALACEADGVHLGQDDLPIQKARDICKKQGVSMLIGTSTHSLQQAEEAVAQSPDYIAVGPLYATQTKPDYTPVGLNLARQLVKKYTLPIFGIGGVNEKTIDDVYATGLRHIAVVSALLQSTNRSKTIHNLKNIRRNHE